MANTYKLHITCVYATNNDYVGVEETIKMGECLITDSRFNTYQMRTYGENLNRIYDTYGVSSWEIRGTKNRIHFNYVLNQYVVMSIDRVFINKTTYTHGWKMCNQIYSNMLLYEPNYKLLVGCSYYGLEVQRKSDDTIIFRTNAIPYTPPTETQKSEVGDFTYITPSAIDRCDSTGSNSALIVVINAINENTLDFEHMSEKGGVAWMYHMLRNYDDPDPNNPTIPPFDTDYGFPGKPSEEGGGNGSMTDTNDDIDLTPPNYTEVGYFSRVYKMNTVSLNELYNYLWSTSFIDNVPKLFSDPFSCIVAMQALPIDAPSVSASLIVGSLDSGITAQRVSNYYLTVDLGSVDITEFWQSFLDYQPYTRLKLYLPYIGIVDLPTDQFMNQSIGIKYRIDVVSGALVAVVSNNTNIICQFTGNCATKLPISANDHASILANSLIGLTAVAGNVAVGNVAGTVASSANVMLGLKEKIQISGSLATNHGILVNPKPYVMIERPTSDIPANYATLKGYTSNISLKLSDCSGFTQISDIKLNGISATDEEKTEILSLLQTGVYM